MTVHRTVMKTIAGGATLALALLAFSSASASEARGLTYKVTIYNLTAGQPFTPPVVAIHDRRADVFTVGAPATEAVRQIAENGNISLLVDALHGNPGVSDVFAGDAPLVPAANPGGTGFTDAVSFTLTASGNARLLSFVSMLVCTNDGFTGVDSIALPNQQTTVYAASYETRTESNTEDFADIVPPCQGLIGVTSDDPGTGQSDPALLEGGVIIPHAGIIGDNDLRPRDHDWGDPVAKIVIERVRGKR